MKELFKIFLRRLSEQIMAQYIYLYFEISTQVIHKTKKEEIVVEEMNFRHQFNESVVYKDVNLGLVENEHKSFYRYKCHH